MVARTKKSARSATAWRGKNPVEHVLTRRVLAVERQIDHDDRRLHEIETRLPDVRLLVQQVHRLSERVQTLESAARGPSQGELQRAMIAQQRGEELQRDLLARLASAERNLRDHEQKLGALLHEIGHAESLSDLWHRLDESLSVKSPNETES